MHEDRNTRARAHRRMALGVLLAVVLLGLVLGVPVGLFVESTMDLVEAQWP